MAGLMQGHGVKLLWGGHRASPTHGTTAASSPGCCCAPQSPGAASLPASGCCRARFPSLPHHFPIPAGPRWDSSGPQCPLQHRPHVPALCAVMNNAEPSTEGLLAPRLLPLPAGARRGNAGSGPRQRVFTVSGEAVNSLGLIESRCCGFGLIHPPPPPPPLDNVSLKPLCKLTAFLRAEHRAAGGPRPLRGSRALGTLHCHQLRSSALILPRSRCQLRRTDPLVT